MINTKVKNRFILNLVIICIIEALVMADCRSHNVNSNNQKACIDRNEDLKTIVTSIKETIKLAFSDSINEVTIAGQGCHSEKECAATINIKLPDNLMSIMIYSLSDSPEILFKGYVDMSNNINEVVIKKDEIGEKLAIRLPRYDSWFVLMFMRNNYLVVIRYKYLAKSQEENDLRLKFAEGIGKTIDKRLIDSHNVYCK